MAAAATGRTPPPPPPPGTMRAPFAPGAEVEVLVDDDFHGHWREATVVRFVPARRRGTHSAPDRYEVAYAHLEEGRGRQRPARSRVRPRPPPPASPPRFLLHDAVEAFLENAWRAGLFVSASPSAVTVAFPVTRKAIEFPPGLVRPRRVYFDGDWAPPSRAEMDQAQAYLCPARVYEVGDKVEVVRRGIRWVSATVARVVTASPVDDLGYVVEYDDDLDLEEVVVDGDARKAATELLHCKFIRPAMERLPREMFQLGPGAAVEAYCDGAWSPAVVRRVVGEGEFEVSIHGKEAKRVVTDKVRPQYNWDGKQWTIVTAKLIQQRQANLKPQSMHGKGPSRPIDVASSGDEQSHDPESPTTKRSRKELQHLDAILSGDSTPQNESVPKSNGETVDKQVLSEIMISDGHLNAPLCVSAGGISELGKKMPSSHRMIRRKVISVKPPMVKNDISKNKGGKTRPTHELLGENDASDKVSRQTNSGSSNTKIHTNETLERSDELCSPLSSSDLNGTVQLRGRKRAAGPMKQQSPLAFLVQLDGTKSRTQQQMERNLEGELNTVGSSNQVPMVPANPESNFNRKGSRTATPFLQDRAAQSSPPHAVAPSSMPATPSTTSTARSTRRAIAPSPCHPILQERPLQSPRLGTLQDNKRMADREWMYTGWRGFGQWTYEWINKTNAFLETTFRKAKGASRVWCPCIRCENSRRQTKVVMGKHLAKYGFVVGYTRWIYHGEADV